MSGETKKVICGICGNHCPHEVQIKDGEFLGPDLRKKPDASPMAEFQRKLLAACPRVHTAKEFVYHPERLNYPLRRVGERGSGQWEQVGWEQALDEIAEQLQAIKNKFGAESVAITTSSEQNMADEYRVRFQSLFGSPNFMGPSCGTGMVVSLMM